MKIKLNCGYQNFDIFSWQNVEIDTDDYVGFQIDYRCDSWHLIGISTENEDTYYTEISLCQASFRSLVNFIVQLNKIKKPVVMFNNMHHSTDFTDKLYELLNEVKNGRKNS